MLAESSVCPVCAEPFCHDLVAKPDEERQKGDWPEVREVLRCQFFGQECGEHVVELGPVVHVAAQELCEEVRHVWSILSKPRVEVQMIVRHVRVKTTYDAKMLKLTWHVSDQRVDALLAKLVTQNEGQLKFGKVPAGALERAVAAKLQAKGAWGQ